MTALVQRPNAPLAARHVLVVLDVDGVLNQLPGRADLQGRGEWVSRRDGSRFLIRVDAQVVRALDEQVQRPGVNLGWLTTWDVDVKQLIIGPFGGQLSGGYVIAARPDGIFIPSDWKLRALLLHLEDLGNPPYAWADDEAIAEALLFRPSFASAKGQRLLLNTDPTTGLTLTDVDKLRHFVDGLIGTA